MNPIREIVGSWPEPIKISKGILCSSLLHLPWLQRKFSLWTWTCESASHVLGFGCCCPCFSEATTTLGFKTLLGVVHNIQKCLSVCKTPSHPFFSLNLRAAQHVTRRYKVIGAQSLGTGSPMLPGCHRESAVGGSGPPSPTSLLVSACLPHFKWSMLSPPRGPAKGFPPLFFEEPWAAYIRLASLLFLKELPTPYFWWSWYHRHQEVGSESPQLSQSFSSHIMYLE